MLCARVIRGSNSSANSVTPFGRQFGRGLRAPSGSHMPMITWPGRIRAADRRGPPRDWPRRRGPVAHVGGKGLAARVHHASPRGRVLLVGKTGSLTRPALDPHFQLRLD